MALKSDTRDGEEEVDKEHWKTEQTVKRGETGKQRRQKSNGTE